MDLPRKGSRIDCVGGLEQGGVVRQGAGGTEGGRKKMLEERIGMGGISGAM